MNKSIKRALRIFQVCLLILVICKADFAEAKDIKSQIDKLTDQMEFFEMGYIKNNTISKRKDNILTKRQMARAAALSLPNQKTDGLEKGEFGGYVTYRITNKRLKSASKNMFGIQLGTNALIKSTQKKWRWGIIDAYMQEDGVAVKYIFDGETDLDYVDYGISLKKKANGTYTVTKKIYCGHWGGNNGQANYKIIYTVRKSTASKYGFVIKGMSIIPL